MPRSILRVTGAMAMGAALAWTPAARADDAHDAHDAHDKAGVAFQEGRRWMEQGNCEAAITKLKESLVYESSVGARLSLAEC